MAGLLFLLIHNVFKVSRALECRRFINQIGNVKTLFHGSKPGSLVGILSRGLLLPQFVTQEWGVERTDAGKLGFGLYFSDNFKSSVQYSPSGVVEGRRVMLACAVALGEIFSTSELREDLTEPPPGFHSVQSLPTDSPKSVFNNSELVVYNVEQQRLKYLIEYSLKSDPVLPPSTIYPTVDEDVPDLGMSVDEVLDPLELKCKVMSTKENLVQPGLQGVGGKNLVLRALHIRANLTDLAAEVIIIQAYLNPSSEEMEAKYVFPLEQGAAVCGFEAFIDDKHVIGKVEEKQEARTQYKKAVQEGHGAYLMEQEEQSDVFTVSVGNLPACCTAVIKIKYVVELKSEGELLAFEVPAAVAPWVRHNALINSEELQDQTKTMALEAPDDITCVVNIHMPVEIQFIRCPSHDVKIKKTSCHAVVELCGNRNLESNFCLYVQLAEPHIPRLWMEKHENLPSQTGMLVFYPWFEVSQEGYVEVMLGVDMSNSMRGQSASVAKAAALLLVDLLRQPDQHSVMVNVVAFGSDYRQLFVDSKLLDDGICEKVISFITELSGSMGSSDLFDPLTAISTRSDDSSTANLVLFSDGHLNNAASLMGLLRGARNFRVFPVSCGDTANEHILRSLASVSGGACESVKLTRKLRWSETLRRQLRRAGQPSVRNVRVDWRVDAATRAVIRQAPRTLTSVFDGERLTVYALLPPALRDLRATLTAELGNTGEELYTTVHCSQLAVTTGRTVHSLAVKQFIQMWEEGQLAVSAVDTELEKRNLQSEVIALSKKHSVICSLTSFVAIEERTEEEKGKEREDPLEQLLKVETMDTLPELNWQIDPTKEQQEARGRIEHLLKQAEVACVTSLVQATDILREAAALAARLPDSQQLRNEIECRRVAMELGEYFEQEKREEPERTKEQEAEADEALLYDMESSPTLSTTEDSDDTSSSSSSQIKCIRGVMDSGEYFEPEKPEQPAGTKKQAEKPYEIMDHPTLLKISRKRTKSLQSSEESEDFGVDYYQFCSESDDEKEFVESRNDAVESLDSIPSEANVFFPESGTVGDGVKGPDVDKMRARGPRFVQREKLVFLDIQDLEEAPDECYLDMSVDDRLTPSLQSGIEQRTEIRDDMAKALKVKNKQVSGVQVEETVRPDESEESDDDMGCGLFDDDFGPATYVPRPQPKIQFQTGPPPKKVAHNIKSLYSAWSSTRPEQPPILPPKPNEKPEIEADKMDAPPPSGGIGKPVEVSKTPSLSMESELQSGMLSIRRLSGRRFPSLDKYQVRSGSGPAVVTTGKITEAQFDMPKRCRSSISDRSNSEDVAPFGSQPSRAPPGPTTGAGFDFYTEQQQQHERISVGQTSRPSLGSSSDIFTTIPVICCMQRSGSSSEIPVLTASRDSEKRAGMNFARFSTGPFLKMDASAVFPALADSKKKSKLSNKNCRGLTFGVKQPETIQKDRIANFIFAIRKIEWDALNEDHTMLLTGVGFNAAAFTLRLIEAGLNSLDSKTAMEVKSLLFGLLLLTKLAGADSKEDVVGVFKIHTFHLEWLENMVAFVNRLICEVFGEPIPELYEAGNRIVLLSKQYLELCFRLELGRNWADAVIALMPVVF